MNLIYELTRYRRLRNIFSGLLCLVLTEVYNKDEVFWLASGKVLKYGYQGFENDSLFKSKSVERL